MLDGLRPPTDVASLWNELRRLVEAHRRPLQVLIGDTADAACAGRSLTRLLRGNRILFDAHPVQRGVQLADIAAENRDAILDETQLDTYLLIGCGATLDLSTAFDFGSISTVFVLDAQRPVHLANLRHAQVRLFDRDEIDKAVHRFFAHQLRIAHRAPRRQRRARRHGGGGVRRKAHRAEDDSADNTDTDDDPSYHSDSLHSSAATSDADSETDQTDDGASDSDGVIDDADLDLGDGERIDWMTGAVPTSLERLYYAGAWCGTAAAMVVFDLATVVGQQNDHIVWNASIGCADQLLRRVVTPAMYDVECDKLTDAVSQAAAARRTLMLADVTNDGAANQRSSSAWRLKAGYDLALFCLNHTSLQSALELDPIMAAKLRVHHQADRSNNLRELLAHVGVSLDVAKRNWREVNSDTRADIVRRLGEELVRLEIVDARFQLTRRCVNRVVGFGTEVTPFDACALFYAEMSRPPRAGSSAAEASEHARRHFWRACDVLDASPHTKQFGDAMEEALHVAEVIGQVTAEVVQPGAVVVTPHVRYTMLRANSGAATLTLAHPSRLRSLSVTVLEALNEDSHYRRRQCPLFVGTAVGEGSTGGAGDALIACTMTHCPGATEVPPAMGELAATRGDFEDGAVTADFFSPLVTLVKGAQNGLSFLESVHLRMAR